MKILSIETSCDETAVSIVEALGDINSPVFSVLGNALFSQINIHKEYGGVFPMLAKREHAKNLPPILEKALTEASLFTKGKTDYSEKLWEEIKMTVNREEGLYEGLRNTFENILKPDIDVISVTSGPGLAPALWVGISCAQALGKLWNLPVIPINHMEGHIASVLISNTDNESVIFPALALLISGGHTEIVNIKNWGEYKVIGKTRDDAVGEAFDKAARMLDLPYPGGPEISRLAEKARNENISQTAKLPRPMLHSKDLDFSFSGLKTSVLYYLRDNPDLSEERKADLAREFEDSVVEVLLTKTKEALEETGAESLIVAGGVIANKKIRESFTNLKVEYPNLNIKIPTMKLATDNALMIAAATYINILLYPEIIKNQHKIIAKGNLELGVK